MSDYSVINASEVKDAYEGSNVPGEFRRFTPFLESEQLSLTLIRIPDHSDFEQSTGHYHDEIEELYIITSGELTMRFNDEIVKVKAGSAVRVAPKTKRSHRNEGDEYVEMWAVSKKINNMDSHKIDDFWEASPSAKQTR
jgi:mannose-6-phosphate isomerase-like protein (cupin superfamily)